MSDYLNGPQKIKYDKLSDAKTCFRLLSIKPGSESAPIETTLVNYTRNEKLRYSAISYTWGDRTLAKSIAINGVSVKVRFNCWYALWQARYHGLSDVWIDAICIDQDNWKEKGIQVEKMHETFKGAFAVYCSVGDHESDSRWLCEQIRRCPSGLRQSLKRTSDNDNWKRPKSQSDAEDQRLLELLASEDDLEYSAVLSNDRNWNLSIVFPDEDDGGMGKGFRGEVPGPLFKSPVDIYRFVKAYNAFASRPYWNRLWTLQEIVLAQQKKLWCGTSIISFDTLNGLRLAVTRISPSHSLSSLGDIDYFIRLSRATSRETPSPTPQPMEKADFFKMLCSKQCNDPRDLFYGSLSITNLALKPNYGQSATFVFLEALRIMMASDYDGIEYSTIVVRPASWRENYREILRVAKRMGLSADTKGLKRWTQVPFNPQDRTPCVINLKHTASVGQLRMNEFQQLYVNTDKILTSQADSALLHKEQELHLTVPASSRNMVCTRGEYPAGLVCPEARVGDLVIPLNTFENVPWERYLILRRHENNLYSIIGQAVSMPPSRSIDIGHRTIFEHGAQRVLNLDMHLDDLINICVQAIIPTDVDAYAWAIDCSKLKMTGPEFRLWPRKRNSRTKQEEQATTAKPETGRTTAISKMAPKGPALEQTKPEQRAPEQTASEQTASEQTASEQTVPEQTTPEVKSQKRTFEDISRLTFKLQEYKIQIKK